jgi:YidC/Oxa1 family membrane protein insertase
MKNKNAKKNKKLSINKSIIEIVFASIFASIILVMWWFFYQKPQIDKENYQKQQTVINNATIEENKNDSSQNNLNYENATNISISKQINDKQDLQSDILSQTPTLQNSISADDLLTTQNPKKIDVINFENDYVKASLNLNGLKITHATLKKYKTDINTDSNLEILSNLNKPSYVDFGFVFMKDLNNDYKPNFDYPSDNSTWQIAKKEDILFVLNYTNNFFDLPNDKSKSKQPIKNSKDPRNDKIITNIKQSIDNGAILLKWTSKNSINPLIFFVLNKFRIFT